MNDSIEELQIRVRELNERLRTWEGTASEERQRCVTITYIHVRANFQGRHQELARIMDRVVEIGLRGGAWAELQNDTPLQPPRIQSDLPMSPLVNTERTYTELPADAESSSDADDTL